MLHLSEEHLLAGHLTAQVQIKAGLFHGAKRMSHGAYACQTAEKVLQSFLKHKDQVSCKTIFDRKWACLQFHIMLLYVGLIE